ncbi:MAG: heme-binding domain-containing protein [Bacteroidales bacterium]
MNKKWYLLIFALLLLGIQAIRIDKTNPEVKPEKDFIKVTSTPDEVATILKAACYDCHSNQTVYPWYSNIAPVSWYIKNHVNEARGRVNFSNWADYPTEKALRKLKACYKDIEEGEMPLSVYKMAHSQAKLSEDQAKKLTQWFLTVSENINQEKK